MFFKQKMTTVFAICLLSGCASPKVYYGLVTASDPDGAVKFKFASSMIVVKANLDSKANVVSYDIKSVPVSTAVDQKYYLTGASVWQNWLVDTKLDVVHRDDTDLIQQVGVEVTDQRIETIKTLGAIATAMVGMAEGTNNPTVPKPIDASQFLLADLPPNLQASCNRDTNGTISCTDQPTGDPDWTFDIKITALPKDSVSLSSILNSSLPAYSSGSFIYSACREAVVTLKYNNLDRVGKVQLLPTSVMIADPSAVEFLRFPDKGKVIAGASCGADSTSEASPVSSNMAVIDALLTQAKGMKDATKKTAK